MNLSVAILAALLVVGIGYMLRRLAGNRRPGQPALPEQNLDGSGRFHAVSIRFGEGACRASRDLHAKRFLADAAPRLPLPLCDARDCQCRFVHHRDRRAGADRRSPFQRGYGGSATRIDADRRHTPDRRLEIHDGNNGYV